MAKVLNAMDKISFIKVDEDVDVFKLADQLLIGTPLMVNFEAFNEFEANKIITFLSGVTYSIDGEIEQVQDKIFLFASKKDYKDGSLRKFIKEYQNR